MSELQTRAKSAQNMVSKSLADWWWRLLQDLPEPAKSQQSLHSWKEIGDLVLPRIAMSENKEQEQRGWRPNDAEPAKAFERLLGTTWIIGRDFEGSPIVPNAARLDVERVRQALRAENENERNSRYWRPIETAPTDGETVIVGRHMGEPWGFVRGYGRYESHKGIEGWICKGFTNPPGELGLGNPSHWMPLPEPPEDA